MDLVPASTPRLVTDPHRLDPAEPFTPAMAARAGIGRTSLERMVRSGSIVRLVRGVYVDAALPLSPVVRARGLALVLGRRHVVVDRTAAWVHGAPALRGRADGPIPLDLHTRRRYPGRPVPLNAEDVNVVGGVRCTSPLRTGWDVARHLAPERALPLLDGLLRAGAISHADLLAGGRAAGGLPGGDQALDLTAMADGRATGISESVLRLHWYGARLPTPTPSWRVAGGRLALALPLHRFGVALVGDCRPDMLFRARASGWSILVLDRIRVRSSDPESLGGHLEREFHRHLLTQMA